jgi:hypothetical protein
MLITLLQPRYPYGGGRIYLPGSLMNLGSRLLGMGIRVLFFDLNVTNLWRPEVRVALLASDFVGFTVIGTPYIPSVLKDIRTLRDHGFRAPILLGGEGITRLRHEQFRGLVRELGDVRQICNDAELAETLDLSHACLPDMYWVSMMPMLNSLDPHLRLQYLSREFCLFLSQGCAFRCRFCAAAKGRRERYRDLRPLVEEVEGICDFLSANRHPTLRVYLSNLDLMQTPEALHEYLRIVWGCAQARDIRVEARGLATTRCFVRATDKNPELLSALRHYGLRRIGFGVDGADLEVWKREGKGHNSLDDAKRAIRLACEADIIPEVLMVTGFPEDSLPAMARSVAYSLRQALNGVVVRPYLGKAGAPGSDQWSDPSIARTFLADPQRFQQLDYAMFGSSTTHPDRLQRFFANASYAAIIAGCSILNGEATPPLLPTNGSSGIRQWLARTWNQHMPMDR